jgi:hypothetical protein
MAVKKNKNRYLLKKAEREFKIVLLLLVDLVKIRKMMSLLKVRKMTNKDLLRKKERELKMLNRNCKTLLKIVLLLRVRKMKNRDLLKKAEREFKIVLLLVVLDRNRKMMKIDLLKDLLKIVLLVLLVKIRKMMNLLRVRKMMNKDLLKKAERELKIAPVVRRNSYLLKERRIRSSLPVKMRAYKDVLKILKDQILPISKHHLKMARSLRVLLRANLRVRSLRVLLRANLRVRSLKVLLRVRSLRVLLKNNLFKRDLSLNGKPKNGTVKNGSLKKTERASNGIKMRSAMMITQRKMMKNSMTKTKMMMKMRKTKMTKKMRNQDLVVVLCSLSSPSSLSSQNSEFNLKSPLVMSAPQLKNLPERIVLPEMVTKTSLSPDLRDPRMMMATKSSSEFEDLMTASLNNFRYLTDVSIYLG